MSDVKANELKVVRPLGGVPFGNMTALTFYLTLALGIWTTSDKATAVATNDKLYLGILPKGMRLLDLLAFTDGGFTDTTTMTLGFEYVDGVDDTDVPQDIDFFCSGVVLTNAAVTTGLNADVPVILPKDAYLVFTNGVANQAAAGVADINIIGICDLIN